MMRKLRLYREFTCLEEWPRPKQEEKQWQEGRSAMEFAKAWTSDNGLCIPDEFTSLLSSHPDLKGLQLIMGIPECETPLPERGGHRNHDLWLLGKLQEVGKVTICVEAKADEPFDCDTVAEHLEHAGQNTKSGIPKRIETLIKLINGRVSDWKDIRYQLLTALCGTVLQAKEDGSSIAVFAVHELRTHKTAEKNLRKNGEDYAAFLSALGIPACEQKDGILLGPIGIDGVKCYVGKAVRYYPQ